MKKDSLRIRILKAMLYQNIKANKKWSKYRDAESEIKKIKLIPDDEFSLEGNAEFGRNNKEEIISMYNYEIGFNTALQTELQKFLDILLMSDEEFINHEFSDIFVTFGVRNSSFTNEVEKQLQKFSKLHKKSDKNEQHINYCALYRTNEPWAVHPECTCPGAYIIRKRMKEGMSFDDAKKWIIDNEML